jgi:hypothetical protein
MSRGNNLQEMEAGTKQSKTAVNASAKPAESMPKLTTGIPDGQSTSWEDLGGPTPENYRSTDDSSKLKDAASGLKQVRDVVNKGAKSADGMKGLKKSQAVKEEEELEDQDFIEEEIDEDDDVISEGEKGEDEEDDDEEEKKGKDEGGKHKEGKHKKGEEESGEEVKKEEYDIEEDVNALLSGEDLSEEFQEKARIIFESALRSKVEEIRESLEIKYEEQLVEEVEEIKTELQERMDAYLEYVSEEWMAENELAIEQGLKTEMTESFLQGMKGLFEEHYVEIPEEKYNVLESMVEKLDEMETKLNEQIEKNIQLNQRLSESVADRIFDEVSDGLASTQKEKLASLAESVEFESESEYRENLETLKEAYFPSRVVAPTATPETLSEGVDIAPEYHSDSMNAYLRTLSAVAKR